MGKKTIILIFIFMLTSCADANLTSYTGNKNNGKSGVSKYTYRFFGCFDTMTDITAFAETDEEFEEFAARFEARMSELHKMFDIYNNYEGMNNIKTINDNAGIQSVVVDRELLDLIILGKQWYDISDNTVNIAMGPVLKIWHEYREMYSGDLDNDKLPSTEQLAEAFELCGIKGVIIDEEASTVFLAKTGMSLDVGAVAKGYAVQLAADELAASGVKSYLVSAGGNVLAKGKPLDGNRVKWGVGIQNPFVNVFDENNDLLDTLFVTDCSIVTSGDYQRYFRANGKIMGHIISPFTLMPAQNFRSVTIIAEDSGIADLLSTALFILPYEEGLDLVKKYGEEAVWVFADGTVKATDGAKSHMKILGNARSTE